MNCASTASARAWACASSGTFGSAITVIFHGASVVLIARTSSGSGSATSTRDGGAARKFQNEVQVGMVGINVAIPVPMAYYSFGGWKDSLFGDAHVHGQDGVRFYTRAKVVTSRWSEPKQRGTDLVFPTTR